MQFQGTIVTNKIVSPDAVSRVQKFFKIQLRLGTTRYPAVELTVLFSFQIIIITITFCCDNLDGKVSLWLWKSLGTLNFFSYFVAI